MKDSLRVGLTGELAYTVGADKTVPRLYPEAPEFQHMPAVLATGFMVGLIEWTCIRAVNPHLDWPREQTVGAQVNLSHSAPTPPGLTVTVHVELTQVDGRRLVFKVSAHDGVDTICEGTHERFVIDAERFNGRIAKKKAAHSGGA